MFGKKWNKYAFLTACVHFVLSFFTDKIIFTYSLCDFSGREALVKTIFAWGGKAAFLLFLILFWQFLFWFVRKADRRFVKYTCIYYALMVVLLILTWPGVWRMDEFGILFEARNIFPVFWQHYFTSIFYIMALMLIPIPSGILLLQNFCISLVVGWLLFRFQELFLQNRRQGWIWLGYLPFLLPPVLDSNLYPMRMSLCAYLELLILAELVFVFREKKISDRKLIILALLSAVMINWRSEAIYYVAALPVCFVFLCRKFTDRKRRAGFIICTLAGTLFLMLPQKTGEKLFYTNTHEYELTSMMLSAAPLMESISGEVKGGSYIPESEEEARKVLEDDTASRSDIQSCRWYLMDQVLDVEKAAEAARTGQNVSSLYWSDSEFVRDYTDEQYAAFKKIYWQLVLERPGVFMKERFQTFLRSEELLENTTELFRREGVANYEKFRMLPLALPISDTLRTKTISLLELRDTEDYDRKLPGYSLVYHVLPAIGIELLVLMGLMWKRRWEYALLLAGHMAKIPLIFMTAPSKLFMYYYPVYLAGYVLFVFLAFCLGPEQGDL